ncbi:hypothetical protein, partial [Streptomyces beihaiensis]
ACLHTIDKQEASNEAAMAAFVSVARRARRLRAGQPVRALGPGQPTGRDLPGHVREMTRSGFGTRPG